jgi:transcriptional regulator with XRE-family HTH domain
VSAYLAVVVKHARTAKGLSQDQVGEAIHYSGSLIGMIETGKRIPTPDVAARLDELLEMDGLIVKLVDEARRDRAPSWLLPWLDAERQATRLRTYQPSLIPGLLQTEAYARAVLTVGGLYPADRVDRLVAARLDRQAVLTKDNPLQYFVVLDEATLRRVTGDHMIQREQLVKLVEMASLPNIRIHVIPNEVGLHTGLDGGFVLASLEDGTELAHLDTTLQGQVLDDAESIAVIRHKWDALLGEAIGERASRTFIEKLVSEL